MANRCIYREENADARLEIWEDGDCRSLWFDDAILQSEIHIHDPAVLPNPVNRAMLSHLMFEHPLERVMLAGCGGGAIARWLHARAPEVAGDAVELSRTVARLAREYFDFPPIASNWRLQVKDVRDFLRQAATRYDFILVDLEENQATPRWVTSPEFLGCCRDHLQPRGTLVLNIILEHTRAISEALYRVRQVFDGGLLLLTEPDHDNLLVFAFRSEAPPIPAHTQLERAGTRWGIDFVTPAARFTRLDTGRPR